MNDKKKFVIPEAMIMLFATDDIITYSTGEEPDDWSGYPDVERW